MSKHLPRFWESNGRGGWVGRREGGREGKKLKEEGEVGGGS